MLLVSSKRHECLSLYYVQINYFIYFKPTDNSYKKLLGITKQKNESERQNNAEIWSLHYTKILG